jgi:hypothetical protein
MKEVHKKFHDKGRNDLWKLTNIHKLGKTWLLFL